MSRNGSSKGEIDKDVDRRGRDRPHSFLFGIFDAFCQSPQDPQSETQVNSSASSTVGSGIDTESVAALLPSQPVPNIAMLRGRNSELSLNQLTDIGQVAFSHACEHGQCSRLILSNGCAFAGKLPYQTTDPGHTPSSWLQIRDLSRNRTGTRKIRLGPADVSILGFRMTSSRCL